MARKRKLASFVSNSIITVAIVTIFTILGVSYARWESSLNIRNTVSTGNMDMYFDNFEEDTWNAIIKNSSVENLIDNCDKINGISIGNNYSLNIKDVQISAEKPVYILYRVTNNGTIPIKLEEENLTVNGNKTIINTPIDINTNGSNTSVSLGREVYTDSSGLQVNLYAPIQDILPGDNQLQGFGIVILKAAQGGNYKLDIEYPFGLANNLGSTSWKKKLTMHFEFTAIDTKNEQLDERKSIEENKEELESKESKSAE